MSVAHEIYIYSPFSAEGAGCRDACLMVKGDECIFVGWEVVEEVCVR
jgi:hypothetical protein